MLFRYDYELIDGRDCLVGGQAWDDANTPSPNGVLYLQGPPLPGPEGIDAAGNHRYVRGADDTPILDPVLTPEEEAATADRRVRIKQTIEDLASALVDEDISVPEVIGKLKLREVRRD